MEAIDGLMDTARDDTSATRAIQDLAEENSRLRRALEARELAVARMYRVAFEAGAPEDLLLPLGRVVEACDHELWRRVLSFVGRTVPGRARAERQRRESEGLAAVVVDGSSRRRHG